MTAKCHNCKVDSDQHKEHGCNCFELDVPNYQSAWTELAGYIQEARIDDQPLKPEELIRYMRELTQRHRKPLSMRLEITPAVIAEGIVAHARQHPEHGYNCVCMDRLIRMWRKVIQDAKPSNANARQSFRYVLVTGERDW